jgi:5'-nucleotidase, C-terminal domain
MGPCRDWRAALCAQVSGIRFKFDASRPPGTRIVPRSVFVGEELVCRQLSPSQMYRVAVKEYMTLGKDGFECLQVSYISFLH